MFDLYRAISVLLILLLSISYASPELQAAPLPGHLKDADGWIAFPVAAKPTESIVLRYRRQFTLNALPRRFPVQVTADNRFILYVNGQRVIAGPSTGDVQHWRYASVDLRPYLRRGRNVLGAVVWNGVLGPPAMPTNSTPSQREAILGGDFFRQHAPLFQQSITSGFRLEGEGSAAPYSTRKFGWRVKIDTGHALANGMRQGPPGYYVAGAPETIDGAKAAWDSAGATETGDGWQDAIPVPDAARRILVADHLPAQRYDAVTSGEVVRTDLAGGTAFPARPVTVPAGSHVKLLLRRAAMISAYPVLRVSGGKGATIRLKYGEALYDAKGKKTDRNLIEDRQIKGIFDTFLPDGPTREFAPLWWRAWRYLEIEVTTTGEPLRLDNLATYETGYPFRQVGKFTSNDPALNRIWQIGWRTAKVDAHETYMDSAYWEQLQYAGDTRLQMLISYSVSGDPRLAEQAIDAFAHSNADGGLTQGAYPSRGDNVIAPFSLLWIGMLDDWRMQQPDKAVLVRNISRMREIVRWFEPWLGPHGLLTKNPQWNFIDWVGQSAADRKIFPSYSAEGNESCLTSVFYLGALRQSATIERSYGDVDIGQRNASAAERLRHAIREHCWSPERRLFADNPDKQVFSQHMNALAVLYDVVPAREGRALLDRIVERDKGIEAPAGMSTTSYYFAWYLIRAFEHVGRGDHYLALLKTWRELLPLNYTTWPEERGDTRSDTHAWSAHPTADLLGMVAGIQPSAPGYHAVRIKPSLGDLTSLDAVAATPKGPVTVRYRIAKGRMTAVIMRPPGLPGTFEWGGKVWALVKMRNYFVIDLPTPPNETRIHAAGTPNL